MRFRVTQRTVIVCTVCEGQTVVSPENNYVYDTRDLTCNCDAEPIEEAEPIRQQQELFDEPREPDVEVDNSHLGRGSWTPDNENQAIMEFEEPLEQDDIPAMVEESEMNRAETADYLKSLKWNELLKAGSNNGITKPNGAKRDDYEIIILDHVFGKERR